MKKINGEKGFLQIIIIVIIALILLNYFFDFNIITFLGQDKIQSTFSYIWNDIIVFLWVNYIGAPIIWAWENLKVLAVLGWDNFIFVLDKIKDIVTAAKG